MKASIESALNVGSLTFRRLEGGLYGRTFRVEREASAWVARTEEAGGLQLRRSVSAQTLARGAGVRVPEIHAVHLEDADGDGFLWTLEEFVLGDGFKLEGLELRRRRVICADLGEQLRLLGTISVDSFGLLPPNPYPTYLALQQWMEDEESRMERRIALAGASPDLLPALSEACGLLRSSSEGPKLCHGDCSGPNVRVQGSRVTAIIDWEWARGSDPAWNVAYWAFWHGTCEPLEELLAGYAPPDLVSFRRRVFAFHTLVAGHLIDVYEEMGDLDGIRFCRTELETAVRERRWNEDQVP